MQTIVSDDEIQVSTPVLNVQDDDHVCMHDDTDSVTRHSVDHTLEEPNMNPSSVVQEPTMGTTIGKRQSTRTSRPPLWQKDFVTSTKSRSKSNCLYSLGDRIEFARNTKGILMHQRKYALEIISNLGLGGSKTIATPVEINIKLTTIVFDKHTGSSTDPLLSGIGAYQRLVGRLIYLTITRPDLSYAVQSLSQFMNAPKRSHMDVAVRVVRYIKQNLGSGILLAAQSSDSLQAYCDVDWGSCLDTRKSITGYMVIFGDSLLSWKSKKQFTVSRSSAEAEYRSMASTVAEVTWIIGLFRELDIPIALPIALGSNLVVTTTPKMEEVSGIGAFFHMILGHVMILH
uniref:Reverse transcriptase Ty1/copia-type domain-containing protein n=1 Tax=Solanum lycopersicum TaxID=4081 RepID=A0A3Q7FHA7_SOLLC